MKQRLKVILMYILVKNLNGRLIFIMDNEVDFEVLLNEYKARFNEDFPLAKLAGHTEIEVINILYDCLENNEKYVVLNETMYGGTKYFLVMGIDEKLEMVPNKVKILEEILDGADIYVDAVTDTNLISILTRLLKAQM